MEALEMHDDVKKKGNNAQAQPESLEDNTRRALREYIDERGISQSKLARKLDLSSSLMSQFLNGNYKGDVDHVCNVVRNFLNLEKKKVESPKKPDFVETSISSEIRVALDYVRINNDLGVIVGDPGIGKSETLRKFNEENPGVEYISISPATKMPIAFLDEILDSLGKQQPGTMADKQRVLIKALKDSSKMFVIDEAQHLTPNTLETIRHIFYDTTSTPLVLAGNPIVLDQMGKGKKAQFAQFFARIGIRRRITGKKTREDVENIVKQSVKNPSKEVIDFLHKKANSFGGFGCMIKYLVLGMTSAYHNGQSLTIENLHHAKRMLEGK